MPKVTHSKFLNYQQVFYNTVVNADMIIELGIESSTAPSGDFLKDFTGSNTRSITWYQFHSLYKADIVKFERTKYGITTDEEGLIYLSPLQIIPVFNDFRVDKFVTHIRKPSGKTIPTEFLINKITYLEPLYDSCIAIELSIIDTIRGVI